MRLTVVRAGLSQLFPPSLVCNRRLGWAGMASHGIEFFKSSTASAVGGLGLGEGLGEGEGEGEGEGVKSESGGRPFFPPGARTRTFT